MNQKTAKAIRRTMLNMGMDWRVAKPMYKRMKKLYGKGPDAQS